MLGQNVLGYPDTGVVIVTNAGSNELFQTCEMLDIVRKYFGAEFGAELKSGEAESPMAYQKLVQTCCDLEGAKETPGRILRGGWKRRTPYRGTAEHRVRSTWRSFCTEKNIKWRTRMSACFR